jgi:uncharacterized RDD family membrane protein YckC
MIRNLSVSAQALSDGLPPPFSSRRMVQMSDEHEHNAITMGTLSTPPLKIKPAPLTRRVTGAAIDSHGLAFLWLIFYFTYGHTLPDLAGFLDYPALGSLAVLTSLYFCVLEGLFAATIGKSAAKLTVLKSNGDSRCFSASFKRNLLRFVDWFPLLYIVGAIAILLSSDRQRIGERFAGTVVTQKPEKDSNPPPAPFLLH